MAVGLRSGVSTSRRGSDAPHAAVDREPRIQVRGVSRSFGGRVVLDDVNLDIEAGQLVALLGRSGCGKSTLLRIIAGLDVDHGGSVTRPPRVAVAFQEPRLLPWKRVSANVSLGLSRPGNDSRDTHDAPENLDALGALREVGLVGRANAWPLTLSGGEAQRASLARALVRNPQLLLLDEPFGALDALTRLEMHRLLLRLWDRHRFATLLVTHDVDEALALADRVVVLSNGVVTCDAQVPLARPRDRTHRALGDIRDRLLEALGVAELDATSRTV